MSHNYTISNTTFRVYQGHNLFTDGHGYNCIDEAESVVSQALLKAVQTTLDESQHRQSDYSGGLQTFKVCACATNEGDMHDFKGLLGADVGPPPPLLLLWHCNYKDSEQSTNDLQLISPWFLEAEDNVMHAFEESRVALKRVQDVPNLRPLETSFMKIAVRVAVTANHLHYAQQVAILVLCLENTFILGLRSAEERDEKTDNTLLWGASIVDAGDNESLPWSDIKDLLLKGIDKIRRTQTMDELQGLLACRNGGNRHRTFGVWNDSANGFATGLVFYFQYQQDIEDAENLRHWMELFGAIVDLAGTDEDQVSLICDLIAGHSLHTIDGINWLQANMLKLLNLESAFGYWNYRNTKFQTMDWRARTFKFRQWR